MGLTHQVRTVKRLIDLRGQDALVYRETKNQFGEAKGVEVVCNAKGLFHEANNYLGADRVEAGKICAAKKPMFFMLYSDTIHRQDILEISGNRFRVTELDDLGNLHYFLDLSLEVDG